MKNIFFFIVSLLTLKKKKRIIPLGDKAPEGMLAIVIVPTDDGDPWTQTNLETMDEIFRYINNELVHLTKVRILVYDDKGVVIYKEEK